VTLPIDWPALIKKYSDHRIPKDVRDDVGRIVAYARRLLQDNIDMANELKAAKQTMIVLLRAAGNGTAGGSLEIPFALIDLLDPRDAMKVEDVQSAYGQRKKFTYVPATRPASEIQ
jgi:hypothetical protein